MTRTLATTAHHTEGRYDFDIDDVGVPALHQLQGARIETMMLPVAVIFALAEQLRAVHGVTTQEHARTFDRMLWDRAVANAGDNVVRLPVRGAVR